MPRTALIVLIAAIGLVGCAATHPAHVATRPTVVATHKARAATQHAGGAARDPRQVARAFGLFYAKLAANEDEPATPAQVRALARALAPICSPPRDGQYPCVVHLSGRVPSTQQCVAIPDAAGAVTGRCSVGAGPAPVVANGYVDCASVGRVVSVSDVSGDEVGAGDPHADLVEVRVAAAATRFCADFHTVEPLSRGSWLGIDINHSLLFAPTINDRRSPAQLDSPVDTPVTGQIGTAGDWTSVVMPAGNPAAPLPRRPFQFRAYANHETFASGAVQLATDSAPDAPGFATYP